MPPVAHVTPLGRGASGCCTFYHYEIYVRAIYDTTCFSRRACVMSVVFVLRALFEMDGIVQVVTSVHIVHSALIGQ